jgi:hypothetical protein
MSTRSSREYQSHGLLRSAWAGVEPLWLVFWIYGVIGGNVVEYVSEQITSLWGQALFAVPAFAYYVWLNVSVWRCAPNSSAVWCLLARATVVLTVLFIPWWIWSGMQGNT